MTVFGNRIHRKWAAALMIAGLSATTLAAEPYPTRAVTIITPFAAGSVTDAAARLIGQHLQDTLGQTFVIENKAGAGGTIGSASVAVAAPDGYTILYNTSSLLLGSMLYKAGTRVASVFKGKRR